MTSLESLVASQSLTYCISRQKTTKILQHSGIFLPIVICKLMQGYTGSLGFPSRNSGPQDPTWKSKDKTRNFLGIFEVQSRIFQAFCRIFQDSSGLIVNFRNSFNNKITNYSKKYYSRQIVKQICHFYHFQKYGSKKLNVI